jgi:type IV secretion system protein VirB2
VNKVPSGADKGDDTMFESGNMRSFTLQMSTYTAPIKLALGSAVITCLMAPPAFAAGTGMPWETPMDNLEQSLTGPIAKAIAIFAIVLFGLAFAFVEHGSALRKGMGIMMGISMAFAASSFGMTFFGFAGGAGF